MTVRVRARDNAVQGVKTGKLEGPRSRAAVAARRLGSQGLQGTPPLPGLLFLSCRLPERLSKGSHSLASPSLLNAEPRGLLGPRTETHPTTGLLLPPPLLGRGH